ncbi:hypothetical protein [Clostridium lacusfryxellense]|uniref:hypothetical protein n=1 Tax=Clostridium lacusfryxellense TaxID=205328 RepID=UPI001C0AC311|nr:hypothetical protein [Clostridium lacusfryxellense]MBU3111658.1 hypothetical protein [Clostridium lacusfryxellense]
MNQSFVLAGVFEIGGGYLIWMWLREGKGILWGFKVENIIPDKFDLIGGTIAVIGALIIMYAPRG